MQGDLRALALTCATTAPMPIMQGLKQCWQSRFLSSSLLNIDRWRRCCGSALCSRHKRSRASRNEYVPAAIREVIHMLNCNPYDHQCFSDELDKGHATLCTELGEFPQVAC